MIAFLLQKKAKREQFKATLYQKRVTAIFQRIIPISEITKDKHIRFPFRFRFALAKSETNYQANIQAKHQANSEYEIEIEYEYENEIIY